MAFSPDGEFILTATQRWLYLYSWDGKSAELSAARLLPGGWSGGFRFADPAGRSAQLALLDTGNSVFLKTISFDRPDAPPVQGDPRKLLDDWQRRLALTFDPQGRIVTPYEVPVPKPAREQERR